MKRTSALEYTGAGLFVVPMALAVAISGCSAPPPDTDTQDVEPVASEEAAAPETEAEAAAESTDEKAAFSLTRDDIEVKETLTSDKGGEHALVADGAEESKSNVEVTKTGDSDGDKADFEGTNAAVFATNGATLDLTDAIVTSDGAHANAVFSYGEGTTLNISHSLIETTGNCSGGIMVTGGGTLNAKDLSVHTTGNSSAAIRSDRGGGNQNVTGGLYVTEGKGSPAIYSTAKVSVSDATLESKTSEGVVVEGKNSVSLKDVDLTVSNTDHNSDKSDVYKAIMIYQSMSGDAEEGKASFSMDGGTLTNKNGDILFVNNTVANVAFTGVDITNEDKDGVLMRVAAAGWGKEGSNGGHVTLKLRNEQVTGDIVVDKISEANIYLAKKTAYTGAINNANEGSVYVELKKGSTWKLTGDSYVKGLTCEEGAIDLNGHKLVVDGKEYDGKSASKGTAIEFAVASSTDGKADGQGKPGDGSQPPAKPDGESGQGQPGDGSQPPAKPGSEGGQGQASDGGQPPAMPDGSQPPTPPDGGQPPTPPDGTQAAVTTT